MRGVHLGLLLGLVLLLSPPAPVGAQICANDCSQHGTCDANLKCSCFAGYTGQDCSLRTCPSGVAWSGKAGSLLGSSVVHALAECANAGLCNRKTGACACSAGFSGVACEVTSCPRSCSASGACTGIDVISRNLGYYGAFRGATYGAGRGYEYGNWDSNVTFGCVCDAGRFGPDCSLSEL